MSRNVSNRFIVIFFSLTLVQIMMGSAPTAAKADEGDYKVIARFPIDGDDRWDYLAVDSAARRLYVTRATHVAVLDADSGKVVGKIKDTDGVHGVALAPALGRGFTSNGRANTATIFDLKTLKVLGTVKTGQNPDAICFEPTTKRVFTFNGRSGDTTAIDASSSTVVGTIELGGKPEFAVADGAGNLYANLEDKSEVVSIDPKNLKVLAHWSIAPGEGPSGLAIDVKNHRLFSVCENKMMVVLDSQTGKVLATPAIGERPDGAAFDPVSGCAFSSNGDGTMTVVREVASDFKVIQNVKTATGARTIALDPTTRKLYLPSAEFGPMPKPSPDGRRVRPSIVPGSFNVLVVGK